MNLKIFNTFFETFQFLVCKILKSVDASMNQSMNHY